MQTIKTTVVLITLILLTLSGVSVANSQIHKPVQIPQFAPDRVLVKFKPGTAASAIGEAHRQADAKALRTIPGISVQVVQVPSGTVQGKVAMYEANPNVQYAEPDYYRLLVVPSEDPGPTPTGGDLFEDQWYLNNTGQWHTTKRTTLLGSSFTRAKGKRDADIDAPEGWELSRGESTLLQAMRNTPKIAVLDSGASCEELDLINKCLEQVNVVSEYTGEQLWDGIDGDVLGHGTFVASEAAADTDNGKGIAGAGWNTSFGAFKVCYQELVSDGVNLFFAGLCPVSASADAIMRASTDKLDSAGNLLRSQYHVITMSYGSDSIAPDGEITPTTPSNAECDAIQAAWDNGVVVVAAAGNNGNTNKVYPAACTHTDTGQSTVIAVAASDDSDNRASFSTYSTDATGDWVSMAAPGEWIAGLLPYDHCGLNEPVDSCVDWWNGTSMAAPLVAGSAALVWAQLYAEGAVDNPSASLSSCTVHGIPCNQVVRERLENGADKVGASGQDLLTWTQHGRLSLEGALVGAESTCGDGQITGELCDTDDLATNIVDCSTLGDYQAGQDAFCSDCTSYDQAACIPLCTASESPAELSCNDGVDNDCDGSIDSADTDCRADTLLPKGESCSQDSQCASNSCKGRSGYKTCK